MKLVLVGYPGSQRIVKASRYLVRKYMPLFGVTYLNYQGPIHGWSSFIAGALSMIPDEHVIFSLDDYLVSGRVDDYNYAIAKALIGGDTVCVKLCNSTPQEHEEYPVTTQYCLWDRKFLIQLLNHEAVMTPWQFEITGSQIFRTTGKKVLHKPCIDYYTNSSISSRWEGVDLTGLKGKDINHLLENEFLQNNDLRRVGILGQRPDLAPDQTG